MTGPLGWVGPLRRPGLWIGLVLVGVAAFLRLYHLGALSLYGDEDITTAAVRSLLRDGYPHMPSGLVYIRGLPYTAVAAVSACLVHPIELAIRLPSAVAGILAVLLLYALLRDLVGRGPALFAAWLLALSAWHVDMSREGRMYSMFLTALLLGTWCFDGWLRRRTLLDGVGAVAGALLTVLLHELGLLIFFVWGLLLYVRRASRDTVRAAALMAAGCGLVWAGDLAAWHLSVRAFGSDAGVASADTPRGLLALVQAMLHINHHPTFHLVRAAWETAPGPYAGLVIASLGAASVLAWRERGSVAARAARAAGAALLVLAGCLGLFGVAAGLLFAGVLLVPGRVRDAARSPAARWSAAITGLWLAGWVVWSVVLAHLPGAPDRWRSFLRPGPVVLDLFGYPAPHASVYLETMPIMTVVVGLATLYLVGRRFRSPETDRKDVLLPAWMWLPLLATGLTTRWIALRYALPTYPAFLALDATAVVAAAAAAARLVRERGVGEAVSRWIPASICAVLLIVPVTNEWHGVGPAWRAATLTYRDPIPTAIHGYPFHPDHKSAGEWVRRRLRSGDVVVAADEMVQTAYVGHIDYWLRGESDARYFTYRRGRRIRSIYTNAPVLERVDDLRSVIARNHDGRVWVITSGELTGRLASLNPPGLEAFLAAHESSRVYTARDGVTRVYCFPGGTTP